ncbi:hypothetical protein RRG08_019578 [Elysia crispata]|uniref:Uncharacterized protein n=1 Tax=Elysia crispata TaxID=231223 RepID=A0AAE0YRQ7_9GAST|nr:hypothetical protein RRG08_019578 [Elysia crispata]
MRTAVYIYVIATLSTRTHSSLPRASNKKSKSDCQCETNVGPSSLEEQANVKVYLVEPDRLKLAQDVSLHTCIRDASKGSVGLNRRRSSCLPTKHKTN